MIKDITKDVEFTNNDDECLSITKCKCGMIFDPWEFIISIYENDPYECSSCKRKLFFRNSITIFEKIND